MEEPHSSYLCALFSIEMNLFEKNVTNLPVLVTLVSE